ncbi:sigma-54 interaction domain-containing protein [Sulfuricella sp.]|uniref:sigma-54 interaction domain-containing protein n=1 Tax=Sulfuricella sp. TaxID=2099377 RepID=UPI002BDFFD90|nr:sigma 54-interacting transcriptional regulator [Sulfuricella sp.]HUX64929.1 sigma 54-interacting transcriptional regulator [Sulfuricella sp.]
MNDKPPFFPDELQSFLETLPEPRILVDPDYRILSANAAYRRAFGNPRAILGHTCYEISHHYDKPCDECGESCPRQTAMKTRQPGRVLHLHHTPRGQEYVDVELIPIHDARGKLVYFVETMRFLHETGDQPGALGMVGRSPALLQMLALLNRAAPAMTPVLLLGESGTGKELAAQAVHALSPRRNRPFVPVDCSGLSENLFEAELFGYEKGAFTGAARRKTGLAEVASGGTLFLDELGDIPLHLQVKLLRLLESGTFRRVGGVETLRADFRLVAATHRNLEEMMEAGTFRRDLYYRIAAFPIHLPALRERREDLPLLAEALLARLAPERPLCLSVAAMARLMQHGFPGNVRELRNILERALLLSDGDTLDLAHLPEAVAFVRQAPAAQNLPDQEILSLDEAERRYVRRALRQLGGDKRELARRLGVSERTLYRKLG